MQKFMIINNSSDPPLPAKKPKHIVLIILTKLVNLFFNHRTEFINQNWIPGQISEQLATHAVKQMRTSSWLTKWFSFHYQEENTAASCMKRKEKASACCRILMAKSKERKEEIPWNGLILSPCAISPKFQGAIFRAGTVVQFWVGNWDKLGGSGPDLVSCCFCSFQNK